MSTAMYTFYRQKYSNSIVVVVVVYKKWMCLYYTVIKRERRGGGDFCIAMKYAGGYRVIYLRCSKLKYMLVMQRKKEYQAVKKVDFSWMLQIIFFRWLVTVKKVYFFKQHADSRVGGGGCQQK